MTKPTLQPSARNKAVQSASSRVESSSRTKSSRARRPSRSKENSAVLVSAVISSYLLTHLHQVLQRAEYGAAKDGRESQAANFAQLRKVLCMDARSMEDASAEGTPEVDMQQAA